MPPFPGAHHNFSTEGDCRSFQTMACSRPPPPRTRIFILVRSNEVKTIRRRLGQCQLEFGLPHARKNVFIYRDALGFCPHFAFSWRRYPLDGTPPHTSTDENAFDHPTGTSLALCFHHCISMGRHLRDSLAFSFPRNSPS